MEIKKTGLWFGRQAVRMCLMVLLVSILAFVLLAVSPIDPLQTNVGQTALGSMSPEQIAKLKSYWGTDLPPEIWEHPFYIAVRWQRSSGRRS